MSKILVIAEHDGSALNPSTAKCVACAEENWPDANIAVAVFAADGESVAADAAALEGIAEVLVIADERNAHPTAAVLAPQIVALADGYSHILGPSTTFGKDLMPRVAALLGVNQISDIMRVDGSHRFQRPIYAGNVVVTVEAPTDQAGRCDRAHGVVSGGRDRQSPSLSPKARRDGDIPSHTRFVSVSAGDSERPDLQTAAKVVSGGRALGSSESFSLIYDLADALGAGRRRIARRG